MITITGKLYKDSSQAKDVFVEFSEQMATIKDDTQVYNYEDIKNIKISSRLANTTRILEFPNGFTVHSDDNDKIDEVLKKINSKTKTNILYKLEKNSKLAFFSLIMIVAVITFFLTIGSNITAKYLAKYTPQKIEEVLSKQTLKTLDKYMLDDSNLSKDTKEKVLKVFTEVTNNDPKYHLYFRQGMGENAFALPNGDIVITDELIKFSDGDMDMIFGVLAHERGHVEYKHSMQMIIKASIVSTVITYLTGDVSSLVASATTALINAKYSRGFESQADRFAKKLMLKNKKDPKHLANFFIKMKKKYQDENENKNNFFASHPSDDDRIKALLN